MEAQVMPTGLDAKDWRGNDMFAPKREDFQPWRKKGPDGKLPPVRQRLVICRFEEDLSNWIASRPHYVYNVGPRIENKGFEIVELPNSPTGREALVWLTHLVTFYDRLDDFTYFLQGNPYPHAQDLDTSLARVSDFEWIAQWETHCDKRGFPHCANLFPQGIPLDSFYRRIFGREGPERYYFGAGAQFVVSKERARSRPVDFYKRILALLAEDEFRPTFGWVLERMWHNVFLDEYDPR